MSKQRLALGYKFYYLENSSNGVPYLETIRHSHIKYGACRDGVYILTDGERKNVLSDLLNAYTVIYEQHVNMTEFCIHINNAIE